MGNDDKKQTYKYIKANSILAGTEDDFRLSINEFYLLYSFYVTHSMCRSQSAKKRDFIDYGWENNEIKQTGLKSKLVKILKLDNNPKFVFTAEDDLREQFSNNDLLDGALKDKDTQRAVSAKTEEANNYFKLFHRVRNGLAHGNFNLVYSSNKERMILIQDSDGCNVTARVVLRLDTLFDFIRVIDKNGIYSI